MVLMMQHGNDISPIQHVASIDHSSKRSLQRWMVGSGFGGFRSRPQQKTQKTCNIKWRSQSNLYAHVVYTPTVSVMTNGLNHYQFKKLRSHYWFTLVPYWERGLVALFFNFHNHNSFLWKMQGSISKRRTPQDLTASLASSKHQSKTTGIL